MGKGFDAEMLKSSWDECWAKERQALDRLTGSPGFGESSLSYPRRLVQIFLPPGRDGWGWSRWRYAAAILPPSRLNYRSIEERLILNIQGQSAALTSDGISPEAFLDRFVAWVDRQIDDFAAMDDLGRARLILRRSGIKIDLSDRRQTWIPRHDFWVVPRSANFAALVEALLDGCPVALSSLPYLLWLKTGLMKQAAHVMEIPSGYRLFAKVDQQRIAQALRLAPTPILLAKYARHNGVVKGQSFTYPVSRSWWISSVGRSRPLGIELRSLFDVNGVHAGFQVEVHNLAYDYNHPRAKQIREHNQGLAKDDPNRWPDTFTHGFGYSA